MTPSKGGRVARLAPIVALVGLASVLLLFLLFRMPDARLYWEYGGRILGGAYVPGYIEWVQHRTGDLVSALMATPQPAVIPYTGFPCEYPPGALLLFSGVRAVADGLGRYAGVFASLIAVLTLATVAIAYRFAEPGLMSVPRAMAVAIAVIVWPVLVGGGFLIGRFDIAPTFLAILGIWLWTKDRAGLGAIACGLGGAIKLWPLFVVPMVAIQRWRAGRHAEAVWICVAGVIGFAIPHLAMLALGTHPADVLSYLGYLRDRPLEIEALGANAAVLLAPLLGFSTTTNLDYGSINILFDGQAGVIKALGIINALVLASTYLAFWLLIGRTRDSAGQLRLLIAATGVILVGTVLTSRVFSGEYVIWFFPFVLAVMRGRGGALALAAYLVTCLLLRLAYYQWDALTTAMPLATATSLAKNVALLLVGVGFGVVMHDAARPSLARP